MAGCCLEGRTVFSAGVFVLCGSMEMEGEGVAVVFLLRRVCFRWHFDTLSKFRKVAQESRCRGLACSDGKSVVMVGWVSRSVMITVCAVVGESTVVVLYLAGYMYDVS